MKIILFGDSITAGYFNGEITDVLNQKLKKEFPSCEIINAGIPGDTTIGALNRIDNHVLKYQPDLVTIFFGTNDVCPSCEVPLVDFEKNLEEIINKIGSEKAVLIGLPYIHPKRYDKERTDDEVLKYNKVVKKLAEKYNVNFIELFEEMAEIAVGNNFYQIDGLHFSEVGYDYLAGKITESLKIKIKEVELDV